MPAVSVNIDGGDQIEALARRFRVAADVGLERELNNQLNRAVQFLPRDARASAISRLPHRHGLGAWLMERTEITQSTQSTADSVNVRTTATSAHAIDRIDQGTVRHPLFGDRRYWYTQDVNPGWWSTPVDAVKPEAEANAQIAVETVAKQIDT